MDSFVFFHGSFVLEYADSSNQRDFFFTVHSLYEYVQSNQSKARDRKKTFASTGTVFFNAFLFFSARLFLVY